jgi:hypothetical protein
MNFTQAINLTNRQTILHVSLKNANGTPYNVRVNGKAKMWKTRPGHFQIPVKRGLREYGYITHEIAENWTVE